MSEGVILDASAVLAWLQQEEGADVVEPLLDGAVMSAVNLSEVLQKAMQAGMEPEPVADGLKSLGVRVEPVTEDDALPMARWWIAEHDLSIADRCCLALAQRMGRRAVSADRLWHSLDAEVLLIR